MTEVGVNKSTKDNKDYAVSFKTFVSADVSVVKDISNIDNDAWVFAIVDHVDKQKGRDVEGLADMTTGKVTIGTVENFQKSKAATVGRSIILHEILHLLGASCRNE